MKVDLTANEFVALQTEMNHLNKIRSSQQVSDCTCYMADARLGGFVAALTVLGFEITYDASGYVIDIAQQ